MTAAADYTGITVTWRQDGPATGWTVYCDPLDGTETDCFFVSQPRCRIPDLSPGDHHIGVVAWHHGRPSPGAGSWIYAAVLEQTERQPSIPVITGIVTAHDSVAASWISQDATSWNIRLLRDKGRTEQIVEGVTQRRALFARLQAATRYGVQVQAVSDDGEQSAWCETSWASTRHLST